MSIQRIIYKKDVKEAEDAKLPFLVVMSDGAVGESDSVRGIIGLLIPEYLDAEDSLDDWNLRVKYARRQAMFALQNNANVVVYDEDKGIINNNYAAAVDDEDYLQINVDEAEKIYVDSEINFIKSLVKIGIIKVLERYDTNVFSDNTEVRCEDCAHRNDKSCNVYMADIDKVSSECESGIKSIEEFVGKDYKLI